MLLFDCVHTTGSVTLCAVAIATCPLLLVPTTLADVGTARPLILPTVVATVPAMLVTSPVSAGIWLAVTAVEVVINVADVGMVVPLMLVAVAVPNTGVTSVGAVASTTLPLPVVAAAVNCLLLFDPSTVADAGTAAPFTCATVGPGYVPLKSPEAAPLGAAL